MAGTFLLKRILLKPPKCSASSHHGPTWAEQLKSIVGNREVVGNGFNGQPVYVDRIDFPYPAIRFKENSPDIQALRQKEKGDWSKLSIEEKKALYRASFRQTIAEFKAPTGYWKSALGLGIALASLSLWVWIFINAFVYDEKPITFSEERKKAQLKRMLDLRVDPITGISSKWDFENNRWK